MDEYTAIGGAFYRYPLDANGNQSGPPVAVSAEEAVPHLLNDYESGQLQVALNNGKLTPEVATDRRVAADQAFQYAAPIGAPVVKRRRLIVRLLGVHPMRPPSYGDSHGGYNYDTDECKRWLP